MNTKRNIIGEVEQMAVNAIVHQPDEKNAAEKHFSDVAKKIVETALQAADLPVGGKGVDRSGSVIVAKTPQTVVFDIKLSSGRRISAELEAESTDHQAQAFLYDGEKPVCQIRFFNQYQTRSYSFPIVRRALNGLMSKVGHGSRYRANRAAKAGEVA